MKKKFHICVLVLATLVTVSFAHADAQKWEIDKAHSNVYFDVRHTYATVRGQFEEFSGTLNFDPDRMQMSSVTIEVSTKSVNTGIANRDNHLRSAEFFDVNKYPAMTFQSTGVKKNEGNQYTLEGNFTIKGNTRKVAVPFIYFGSRENPLKKGQLVAGFETRFSINRLDYQVGPGKYLEMGVIGNQVDILITLEVVRPK
ncbi:MAG: YceI family protein [Desulfobacterales bacterium]